jgi:hypothetical protein
MRGANATYGKALSWLRPSRGNARVAESSALVPSAQSNIARGGYSQYLVVEPPELAGDCLIVTCFQRSLCFEPTQPSLGYTRGG